MVSSKQYYTVDTTDTALTQLYGYLYDSLARFKKETRYTADSTVTGWSIAMYNDAGHMATLIRYTSTGAVDTTAQDEYDGVGVRSRIVYTTGTSQFAGYDTAT